ncbi:MAG: hypothetical protein ABUT39_09595 [Acidobacteriota bacterium]
MESIAPAVHPPETLVRSAGLTWTIPAMLVGSTSIAVGLLWDISWHMTIGRDTFWTPAHMAIYLGGVLAGICGGWLALRTTFAGTPEERAAAVRFWGFRAPYGAWVAIWGALAMLTSAPFDDWWHNVYGLDVKILSPPHTVLAAGMIAIQVGTMLLVLAPRNRASEDQETSLGLAFVYAAGIVLLMLTILLSEYGHPNEQHAAIFYKVSCAVYPALLAAVARSSRLRWPATLTAASYMLVVAAMVWILPLFPARPLLGPINNPLDHMAPPAFPLLLVVPALGIDLLMRRRKNGWKSALLLGAAFVALFFVAQWLFAEFLLSPASRNAFFAGDRHWSYGSRLAEWRYQFWNLEADPVKPATFATAFALAVLSSRLGIWWGDWMARVRR